MRWQKVGYWIFFVLMVVVLGGLSQAIAADDDDDNDDSSSSTMAGVYVDADGVLRTRVVADPSGMLTRQRIQSALAGLDPNVVKHSKRRKISLNRLAAALEKNNGVPTDTMRYLAGLQRVQYVFFYPETNDIVIAGPAQGWMTNLAGRVVGIGNERPTIQLQDLVVALRAFAPDGKETSVIGCSIDPTPEGLASMQQFLRRIGGALPPGNAQAQTQYIAQGLQTSLGLQNVSLTGVSPQTHFAQVLVEADYRMKLIGIGLEQPPIRLKSFVDRANPSDSAVNALQRWYFLPDYKCVRVTEDGLAMELVGDGVKLIGEDEAVTSEGMRKKAARGSRASRQFVREFTLKYAQLANRSPIFAELRNLIDLSVAAAFIQHEGYYERSGWDLGILGDESQFKVETYAPPKQVETAVAAKWKGGRLMTPVGGGVHIEATEALDAENLLSDQTDRVKKVRHSVTAPKLAEGQWWWD